MYASEKIELTKKEKQKILRNWFEFVMVTENILRMVVMCAKS